MCTRPLTNICANILIWYIGLRYIWLIPINHYRKAGYWYWHNDKQLGCLQLCFFLKLQGNKSILPDQFNMMQNFNKHSIGLVISISIMILFYIFWTFLWPFYFFHFMPSILLNALYCMYLFLESFIRIIKSILEDLV